MKTHFLNIEDLSPKEIQALIKRAREIKKNPRLSNKKLAGKVIASLFFEPSTRTRLSFESAALRLGAGVIGFADPLTTSYGGKGESFLDTIRIISGYADLIIIRHPKAGAAQKAAKVSSVPVINAGDGPNQHPTQTLLDLMAIQETQKKINNLNIALMGDL
ncbi:aspartate carbamoyltransferase, partial [Patescibacteria group bacterium]|nr:aspartate carbamoyltransferase [Patescibacteria group bacterium]